SPVGRARGHRRRAFAPPVRPCVPERRRQPGRAAGEALPFALDPWKGGLASRQERDWQGAYHPQASQKTPYQASTEAAAISRPQTRRDRRLSGGSSSAASSSSDSNRRVLLIFRPFWLEGLGALGLGVLPAGERAGDDAVELPQEFCRRERRL